MPCDLTLLLPLSASRRSAGSSGELIHSAEPVCSQPLPSAGATAPRMPDPRRHSVVCCCLLCEQHGTGEQAMRAVGSDYERFLARVSSSMPRLDRPACGRPKPSRKPSRKGDHPMRRREPARALGPYPQENQWRVIQIDAKGRRKSYMLDSRQAAHRLIAKLHSEMHGRTVEAALDLWIAARLRSGTSVKSTVQDQAARARSVLSPVLALHLDAVTERKALALYEQTTQRPSRKSGRPLRAATHHFYLAIVQRMWRWAQKQGYAKNNPWAEVEPLGRPSVGKAQLRPAEARRFAQVAEEQARAGSDVALAALCCLSLGLRASEALGITARDVDAEAGEVYINGTKTAAARRRLKVSPNLGRLLVRAASGRQPEERLCLAQRQALHSAVIALCARAGVPRVCVHGLRGTHASLAVSGGASVEAVARVLGHTSVKMTLGHYVTDEAATGARLAAVEAALTVPESFRDRFSEKISDGENESPLLSKR